MLLSLDSLQALKMPSTFEGAHDGLVAIIFFFFFFFFQSKGADSCGHRPGGLYPHARCQQPCAQPAGERRRQFVWQWCR